MSGGGLSKQWAASRKVQVRRPSHQWPPAGAGGGGAGGAEELNKLSTPSTTKYPLKLLDQVFSFFPVRFTFLSQDRWSRRGRAGSSGCRGRHRAALHGATGQIFGWRGVTTSPVINGSQTRSRASAPRPAPPRSEAWTRPRPRPILPRRSSQGRPSSATHRAQRVHRGIFRKQGARPRPRDLRLE